MLPTSRSAVVAATAGPSRALSIGSPPRRTQPQMQPHQKQRLLQLAAVALLALVAAGATIGVARTLGGGSGNDDNGGGGGLVGRAQAWRGRLARREALAAIEAELPPGILRRAREHEAEHQRLRERRRERRLRRRRRRRRRRHNDDDDDDDDDDGGGYDAAATLGNDANNNDTNTFNKQNDEESEEERLARITAELSRWQEQANLTSAQRAEANHDGHEDPTAAADDPDDTDFRVLCVGDSLTLGLYQGGAKYRPYAIALGRALREHLKTEQHAREHAAGSEDRHEHGAPKKRLERKRHRARTVRVVSAGVSGETVLGGMRGRLDGLLSAAERDGQPRFDVVVILGGINDILRDRADPVRLFDEGLARMYMRARRGHGAATLAVTLLDEAARAQRGGEGQDDGGDSKRRREDVNRRMRDAAAVAFAQDLQSAELRREDGDWSDGGYGPLRVFDAAAAVPLLEAEADPGAVWRQKHAEANGAPHKEPARRRTKWFDPDALHLSYDGYERLGEMMAQRIVEMGWL